MDGLSVLGNLVYPALGGGAVDFAGGRNQVGPPPEYHGGGASLPEQLYSVDVLVLSARRLAG